MFEIYVLKLEQDKYYIGKTKNSLKRITNHFRGKTTAWTSKYRPISVIEIIHDCDAFDEDKYTKKYMTMYGIDNVRGGSYVKMHIPENVKAFLRHEFITAEDRCYNCGKSGHFVRNCPEHSMWSKLYKYIRESIINFVYFHKSYIATYTK